MYLARGSMAGDIVLIALWESSAICLGQAIRTSIPPCSERLLFDIIANKPQRAFRQRKEGYIKKLEEQVKESQTLEQNFKALQNENYQLREYILSLQSRLLENQADFPPAPAHATLSTTASSAPPPHTSAPESSSYRAEQQLRREMEQQRPPPAPVVAREDASPYPDGLRQLQQAAASAEGRPAQSSPYGLGNDYSERRPQMEESSQPPLADAKPSS